MEVDVSARGQIAVGGLKNRMEDLPEEVLEIIRLQQTPRFLGALAEAALKPKLTLKLFTRFEAVFVDTCARWIEGDYGGAQKLEVITAFARILPLAQHLSTYLEKYLEDTSPRTQDRRHTPRIQGLWNGDDSSPVDTLSLQRVLLAAFRLLNFNKSTYSRTISTSKVQAYLQHEDRGVRYLAVRVLCQILSASDMKLEVMIEAHVGKEEAVMGDYDGRIVDYGFLSLLEEKGLKDAQKAGMHFGAEGTSQLDNLCLVGLSKLVVRYSSILVPRPFGQPPRVSSLIATATTASNLETFAEALLSSSPILLHGLAGSGKTSLVNDVARELGADADMVTLHLNEQTDAKMLIGMYATGSTPGSFTWRAGVLTTAVREGRWVFIEDLDRAPNEVISVILPLIERGELLIPSRGETIKAGPGFKLLASIRTSLNVTGHENPPALHMLGARLWRRVPVQMPTQDEFREIINGTHPILNKFLPGIINVYDRLYTLSHKPSFASKSRTSLGRPISPRDLLKWCRRLEAVLLTAGSKTEQDPITDATQYEMFLEAVDCFAGSLQTEDSRKMIISSIAEEMQIDPQRVDHFITSHIPKYEETESTLAIGRARLAKRPSSRVTKTVKKTRPFANTTHAKRLLEQVGVAIKMAEPVLLVGETGIGKTAVVQQLADVMGYKLTAVNLSQQSDVGDLLGGFKPVDVRSLAIPLKDEFDDLFASTGISATRNEKYLGQLGKCVARSQWSKASKLWREAPKMFDKILSELSKREAATQRSESEHPLKRRKTGSKLQTLLNLQPRWVRFTEQLDQFDIQLSGGSKGFAFTFVEGNIVKAARNGDWVLLDEINLASPDTLESIADLLYSGPGGTPSILLSETGEIERVKAHPNFRIFGAMNPATDVGKRDLPMGLRSRFTEIYVDSPDRNLDDLLAIIKAYLKITSTKDEPLVHAVAKLYLDTKRLADQKQLVDGANQVPHFSLRTLTRVLSYVVEIAPSYELRRALYEGFAMGFLTLLNRESEDMLAPLINHHLLDSHSNPQALLSRTPKHPEDGKQYVRFMNKKRDRQYWMLQGIEPPQEQPYYIITPSVERNMLNLVRATSTRRFPVLIQGPTSSGKTSMIEYLAKFSGNKFVRINNHEHTDLQEYLGTYVSGADGQLRFQEGLLVQALRQGHWIVLDELNLAPTDVLEALNRLLDDNRELLIPETQEIVRPHENFMLFATQNPPGLYGGRKTLSRAFRNRFLELHFDDIPENELEVILEKRSQKVAPSDCTRIVTVYKELSRLRQSNRLFEQKDSFATLRDLFRWALRDADNREQLAANGYMLLGERVRNPEERNAVKKIIEQVMKVKIDPVVLYDGNLSAEIKAYDATSNSQGVVWTQAMRRLYVLVAHALRNNEPVLLVGETGCGKTTVCQMLAEAFGKELHIVNAHQNTETGDLIGAQRPVRNRAALLEQLRQDLIAVLRGLGNELSDDEEVDPLLAAYQSLPSVSLDQILPELRLRINQEQVKAKALFEWSDGSLVQAMKEGQFFLLDEISLADDSVLERLNSVLETQRTILLAEKGVEDSFIQAADGFQFFATMNPGGDYGKRELSPALRNRFTEIWVPSLSEHEDVFQIVEAKLDTKLKPFSKPMVLFAEWFGENYRSSSSTSISVRDVLAWVKFMNGSTATDPYFAVLHGAAMVYVDTLGANPAALLAINPASIRQERAKCLQQLSTLVDHDISSIYFKPIALANDETALTMGDFSISKTSGSDTDPGFAFEAPTTKLNGMRVIRALQVQKPILIEGSPGVGKTTLIAALARACNKPLTRINLSEQTDLMDLFGSDVPVEGAEAGHFAWRDAPFLQAMQRGEWVLLDEMNLASQSVLEGLNACLDHRGEVYISELDQTFKRHPNFSVFAAQNPHHQGGGRKGLPSSFVNRFTVVYADVFGEEDLELICAHNFPDVSDEEASTIIDFVSDLEQAIVHDRKFGSQGGPWEFNLRDILRWLQLLDSKAPLLAASPPSDFLNLIFRQRFRTPRDREEVNKLFERTFGIAPPFRHFFHNLSSSAYQVGIAYMSRDSLHQRLAFPKVDPIHRLPEIESIMICVQQNIPCILVGTSGSGKTTTIEHIAATSGKDLVVFPLNADIDTMDLVGGFEQVDPQRAANAFLQELKAFIASNVLASLPDSVAIDALSILELMKRNDESPSASLFSHLSHHLRSLQEITSLAQFNDLADTCQRFADTPMTLENARFEWVDGVLVKALEQGKWLVLDNANLCSASVLDRLNSLLEPNGYLSINEHCGPDGEPKIVIPHPEFRIFLTMDARFGELSRAMRNRAIEIFLEPFPVDFSRELPLVGTQPEAAMLHFRNIFKCMEADVSDHKQTSLLLSTAVENMSWADTSLLPRFTALILQESTPQMANIISSISAVYTELVGKTSGHDLRKNIGWIFKKLAGKTGQNSGTFTDAQIIHPNQNSPLIPLFYQEITDDVASILWLGAIFDLLVEVGTAKQVQRSEEILLDTLKPSKMNRLQRSLVRGRVSAVAKDSTVNIAMFLTSTLDATRSYLQAQIGLTSDWKQQKAILRALLRFWWDTFYLATSPSFDEATFRAHLSIGTDLITDIPRLEPGTTADHPVVKSFFTNLVAFFSSGFALKSGLHMEILWKHLRPTVISSQQVMVTLHQMEELAARFDALRWKTSIPVSELGNIMSSLVEAYKVILTSKVDGNSLVKTLTDEMEKLESSIGREEDEAKPFLAEQFEALRQLGILELFCTGDYGRNIDKDVLVLANNSTTSQMRLSSSTTSSRQLQFIDFFLGSNRSDIPITNDFSSKMLNKLNGVGEVDLKSLKLLESELPILGQKLASSTELLGRDQIRRLNVVLLLLLTHVTAGFHSSVSITYESVLPETFNFAALKIIPSPEDLIEPRGEYTLNDAKEDAFMSSMASNFKAAVQCLAETENAQPKDRVQFTALAWVNFAVSCLAKYVPDQAFDPDKRQRLELQQHNKAKQELMSRLAALKQFEHLFSGQDSNFRCQMLEEDIQELGEPPQILQQIYRPEVSEMDALQGEFNNLLNIAVWSEPQNMLNEFFETKNERDLQQIQLLQNNISQVIRRLSDRFRAYNDLTAPAISMLRCMQIGLYLATLVSSTESSKSEASYTLSQVTPFLGSGPYQPNEDIVAVHPMQYLDFVSTTVNTQGLKSFSTEQRQLLLYTFQGCFEQYKKRQDADRVEAESKSGLYRFRGSADEEEDDQEEFNELFPEYDEEPSSAPGGNTKSSPIRETAIQICNVHAEIFSGAGSSTNSIMKLIRSMSKQIGSLRDETPQIGSQNMTASLLPGTLLLLDDQIESLGLNAGVLESYNFYTDANLPETRKLVELIYKIQARFRELQAVDEIGHMQPLEDVLVSCRELLRFRHTEPLAKIITKVEKVHTFMHEWQFGGWASRANTALTLYDALTATIVSWRRLELSTWAKLFDMELAKCHDDARAWWFLAYETIIAASEGMSDSPEQLRYYAQKLLEGLEVYFSKTIMGQFSQRLQLVKQLQKHLELLILDLPSLSIIHGALANFIALYSRYEKPVEEALKKGKVTLEKRMRDVILLASWKDTNIVALKDSAKRSHHNLFKIVRKFRALLGQPMEFILKQGLPDEASADTHTSYEPPMHFPSVDQHALEICASSVPNWTQKSKRFVNVSKTVSMMSDAAQLPSSAVEGSTYLDEFLANIITSTVELQKATPSVLNEENKDTVKHLKTRKRKLYADTLKELRQMGFKFNLGVDALAHQDSLSKVLSSVEILSEVNIQGMEYYFHKSIDLAPRAREAAQQHSEDLSSAEVARSTGFLEGLLQVLLSQRNTLSDAATGMANLEATLTMAKGLWAPTLYNFFYLQVTQSNHEKVIRWLPNILKVAEDLVRVHTKLSQLEAGKSHYTIDQLSTYSKNFQNLAQEWDALSKLPPNLASTQRLNLESSVDDEISELNTEVEFLIESRPDLAFILKQIAPWTRVDKASISQDRELKTITHLDEKLSVLCDTVLVAIEKHKKTISELPTSTEDPSWLVKSDTCLMSSIKALHSDTIVEHLEGAFDIVRSVNLEGHSTSRVVGASFAVALPILEQYFNILKESVMRYGQLYRATCKTSYILGKTFIQIATQGFCTPAEKSNAQDGKTEKLEGGTGLGDGEGAEDISKDIGDDEDLDELAQEPNKEGKQDIEDEKDAVDMADGEMEGEMGEGEEKEDDEKGSGDEEEGDEMDEEAGDVDDLDPTAVDEKMWDGDGEEAEKDQEGDQSKGKKDKDDQVAAQEGKKGEADAEEGDEGDEEEMVGEEQGEEVKQDEVEKHDPHAREGEALDLPEDMELDGDEEEGSAGSDDGMEDLSDVEQDKEEEVANDGKEEEGAENADANEDQDIGKELDVIDLDEEDEEEGEGDKTQEAGEKAEESEEQEPENQEGLLHDRNDDAHADDENAVPSDVQGVGEDQDESNEDNADSATKAQREEGGKGGDSSEQKDAAAEDGEKGRQANGDAPQDSRDETQNASAAQPFKKLGDALESWHRQQTQIRDPAEQKENGQDQDQSMDVNKETSEFQHLQDEDAQADTQAMGTATEEQAHALDESMAVDTENKDMPETFQPDEVENDEIDHDDVMDIDEPTEAKEQEQSDAYEGRAGAMIKQANQERDEELDESHAHAGEVLEEDVEEVDNQLESTHLDPSTTISLRSATEARQQWTNYESLTRDLSLSLTEQLRLILAPTLATKMRGDFRTGKRLNIKRIIPYIASQYKRDKIWMRRSVPSKRSYQIMLAVDDSKSMNESGSGSLALETLVMVSKSLSMLEVGEISVVAFGDDVRVAHEFDQPFSSDSGPSLLQNFSFSQNRTNITTLVRESITLFRTARQKASSSPADLWQISLIISDGVCDSSEHDAIRRLLREAMEERIMMVFVIVDDVRKKGKGESVLDLRKASFVKDEMTGGSRVVMERYLDTFPFQYYIVVGDVRELPGVLATLLRQWFAEVVDSNA